MTDNKKVKPNKKDVYYIGSGFFNAKQIETVDKIENSLEGLNIKFFSPRSESIEFFKESNAEYKSMITRLIFNNNLDSISSCNKFIINLQDEDQGTLFEYGYIVGLNLTEYNLPNFMSRNIKVMNDSTGLELKVMQSLKSNINFSNISYEFVTKGKDFDLVRSKVEKYPELTKAVRTNQIAILSIDDRDPINMFLTGLFYSRNVPIVTYSRKGYGSNVMLVHSTYHCENESELDELLKELSVERCPQNSLDGESYLTRLRMNKQTWNKSIE